MPPRSGRNGIIRQYLLEWSVQNDRVFVNLHNFTVSVESPTFDSPSVLTHTVTGLTPYTFYGWRIAAVNDAGIGPFSGFRGTTTEEDGKQL